MSGGTVAFESMQKVVSGLKQSWETLDARYRDVRGAMDSLQPEVWSTVDSCASFGQSFHQAMSTALSAVEAERRRLADMIDKVRFTETEYRALDADGRAAIDGELTALQDQVHTGLADDRANPVSTAGSGAGGGGRMQVR